MSGYWNAHSDMEGYDPCERGHEWIGEEGSEECNRCGYREPPRSSLANELYRIALVHALLYAPPNHPETEHMRQRVRELKERDNA